MTLRWDYFDPYLDTTIKCANEAEWFKAKAAVNDRQSAIRKELKLERERDSRIINRIFRGVVFCFGWAVILMVFCSFPLLLLKLMHIIAEVIGIWH